MGAHSTYLGCDLGAYQAYTGFDLGVHQTYLGFDLNAAPLKLQQYDEPRYTTLPLNIDDNTAEFELPWYMAHWFIHCPRELYRDEVLVYAAFALAHEEPEDSVGFQLPIGARSLARRKQNKAERILLALFAIVN